MKSRTGFVLALSLLLLSLTLTACAASAFGLTENTGKRMVINAERADKNAFFMLGTLEVDEGEKIEISAQLAKGSIRVEIIATDAQQSIDKLPDTDGNAVITANLHSTDGTSGTLPAGYYLLKATCLEKATGTVLIEVKSAA